jgi:hypothetical protein
MKGAAWAAALIRSSEDALGSLMMPNKKSSGDIAGFAAAASIAAFMSAVFLSCLAYHAGARRAFRLVSILVALLFSEGLTWADRTRYTSHSVAR